MTIVFIGQRYCSSAEAQRAAVLDHVASKGQIAAESVEIKSGTKNERPQPARATAEAKRKGAAKSALTACG